MDYRCNQAIDRLNFIDDSREGIEKYLKCIPTSSFKRRNAQRSKKKVVVQSIICGTAVGLICGFVGAGGAMRNR